MGTPDRRRAVAADRTAPTTARCEAVAGLARDVEPTIPARADLWLGLLHGILFDETEDETVRIAAAEAAGEVGPVAVNALCGAPSPARPALRATMVASLRRIGAAPQPDHHRSRLDADLAALQEELTTFPFVNLTLAHGAQPGVVGALRRGLAEGSAEIRASALTQLARVGELADPATVLRGDGDPALRAVAAEAIGVYWTGDPASLAALRAATFDDAAVVAEAAKVALRRMGHESPDEPVPGPAAETAAQVAAGPPASDDEIAALEARLGGTLPPSYREFLCHNNGGEFDGPVRRVRPPHEVRRFAEEEQGWITAWLDAQAGDPLSIDDHVAARGQDPVRARWPLLVDCVQVSDVEEGSVYLLCPTVLDADGEWEAWWFATWLPGAQRHRSWSDLVAALTGVGEMTETARPAGTTDGTSGGAERS